ncbi:hypothetical protein [Frankia sp. AgB32]|uniref:hypothetical protein n=1 Tax=Frankia sp. AgB32 TaxID=631119 RepID=UPI00200BA5EA|nr:hypothetical protein [Frankia sp. AgB32]MCK9895055.1 hypothetical protein [Frankia sp. AgB32]
MTASSALPGRLTGETLRQLRGRWSTAQLRALPATVDVETAGSVLGMGLWKARALIRDGRFPTPVIRHGQRYVVPTRPLLMMLGVEPDTPSA